MKKVFIFFVSFFLLFSIIFEVNAKVTNPKIIELNMNIYKKKLEKAKSGEKYLEIVNKKLGEKSEEELKSISEKVYNYLKTYKGKNFNLLKYIQYRSDFLLKKGDFGKKSLEKENLEIYKNKKLGFEILKEKSLIIVDDGIGIGFGKDKESKVDFKVFLVDYNSIEKVNTFSDFVEKFISDNYSVEKLNINGLEGYKISYEVKSYLNLDYYKEFYIFGDDKNKIVYNISFIDKNYKYKEKILNSFKIYKNINKNFIISFQFDTKRFSDIFKINLILESYFVDYGIYPEKLQDIPIDYLLDKKIPKDPKHGQVINGCKFGYTYEKISEVKYKLSTCLENESNKEKTKNDGGIYDDKYEIISG